MNRTDKDLSREESRALLQRARFGHLAGTQDDAVPIVRSLHHAILGDDLIFHGRRGGEKLAMLGRPAVFECVEEIAAIPSYWIDKKRACPATTYYCSVQVKGRLREFVDPVEKAGAMTALMQRLQPEGLHLPIMAQTAEYAAVLKSLYVYALSIDELSGRRNIGANKSAEQMQGILEGLWQRGHTNDLGAMELILSTRPGLSLPFWPELPSGYAFKLVPSGTQLRGQEQWLGIASTETGQILAEVSAVSNFHSHAWILGFECHSDHRGRGLERALMLLLTRHPAIRRVARIQVDSEVDSACLASCGFQLTKAGNHNHTLEHGGS